jgi:AraC-like DNA-binding protein
MAEIVREQKRPALGGEVAIGQLALLMFVQILRAHAESEASTGWLAGLADRRLAPAFTRMHGSPERAWTLTELARACAMSRAAFAERFKQVAGTTPLAYLAAWRIRLARRGLERGASVGELALELGYSSESALSHAFKRIAGTSPRAYRDAWAASAADGPRP